MALIPFQFQIPVTPGGMQMSAVDVQNLIQQLVQQVSEKLVRSLSMYKLRLIQ